MSAATTDPDATAPQPPHAGNNPMGSQLRIVNAQSQFDPVMTSHASSDVRRRSVGDDAVQLLSQLRRALERDPAAARATAARLLALLDRQDAGEVRRLRGGLAPWQQRRIERYLCQRLKSPVHVMEMAREVSLSVSHFCRAFKESFGVSPHLHLTRLRTERAQHLMLTTADPLSQIALACGLADQAHLSKIFHRVMGETPSAWRRRNITAAGARTARRQTAGEARAISR